MWTLLLRIFQARSGCVRLVYQHEQAPGNEQRLVRLVLLIPDQVQLLVFRGEVRCCQLAIRVQQLQELRIVGLGWLFRLFLAAFIKTGVFGRKICVCLIITLIY